MNIFTKNIAKMLAILLLTLLFLESQAQCDVTYEKTYCIGEQINLTADCDAVKYRWWWHRWNGDASSWSVIYNEQGKSYTLNLNIPRVYSYAVQALTDTGWTTDTKIYFEVLSSCEESPSNCSSFLDEISKRDSIIKELTDALLDFSTASYFQNLKIDSLEKALGECHAMLTDCNGERENLASQIIEQANLVFMCNLNLNAYKDSLDLCSNEKEKLIDDIEVVEGELFASEMALEECLTNLGNCQQTNKACEEEKEDLSIKLDICRDDLASTKSDTVIVIIDDWQCGMELSDCEDENIVLIEENEGLNNTLDSVLTVLDSTQAGNVMELIRDTCNSFEFTINNAVPCSVQIRPNLIKRGKAFNMIFRGENVKFGVKVYTIGGIQKREFKIDGGVYTDILDEPGVYKMFVNWLYLDGRSGTIKKTFIVN